jgi:hypothetical protein
LDRRGGKYTVRRLLDQDSDSSVIAKRRFPGRFEVRRRRPDRATVWRQQCVAVSSISSRRRSGTRRIVASRLGIGRNETAHLVGMTTSKPVHRFDGPRSIKGPTR